MKVEIEALRTKNGGYTKADLAMLGIEWPPKKGWLKKLKRGPLNEQQRQFLAEVASRDAATKPKRKQKAHNPPHVARKKGYQTDEWKRLRYDVLKASNGRCCLCGASAHDGVRLNVDHIKPVKTHPHLMLSRDNLQVLCSTCNWGKGNRDDTDWREEQTEWERIPWEKLDRW